MKSVGSRWWVDSSLERLSDQALKGCKLLRLRLCTWKTSHVNVRFNMNGIQLWSRSGDTQLELHSKFIALNQLFCHRFLKSNTRIENGRNAYSKFCVFLIQFCMDPILDTRRNTFPFDHKKKIEEGEHTTEQRGVVGFFSIPSVEWWARCLCTNIEQQPCHVQTASGRENREHGGNQTNKK